VVAAHPVVVVKQTDRRPLYVQVREKLEIGRECDGLLIDDLQCSRRHVSLTPHNGAVVVEDLGSTNGTFVNGESIQEKQLNHADRLTVGQNSVHFSLIGA